MQPYEHRQPLARWVLAMLGAVALLIVAIGAVGGAPVWPVTLALVIPAAAVWMLAYLVTRVDPSGVSWSFTWGWPGGRIGFTHMARVERTRLNWMERSSAGWHWSVWHGWLWNVAGAEAIEIYGTEGRRTTLGTDDPQGLVDAIERFRRGAA